MSMAYALTFFCEVLLYYGGIGCIGLLYACVDGLFMAPLLLWAGCWLSGRLLGGGRPWWLRWVPTAVILPCLLLAGNWPGRLVSLPAAAYLVIYIMNNKRAPDYDYAVSRFRGSLIVAGLFLLLAALFRSASWKRGLPYLFLYFTLNVTLLRLLRHYDSVARSRRFRALNLGGVALVCAAGFGLSQPGIVSALKAGWLWFLDNVVLNLVALAMTLIQWVIYGLAWLLSPLFGNGDLGQMSPPAIQMGDQTQRALPAVQQVRALPPAVRFALEALGIALLTLAVLAVLRALSRRVARSQTAAANDVRESLDAGAPPRSRRPGPRRGSTEDGVRQQYRRALTLTRARGGRVAPTMNTLQIQQENAPVVDADAMRELREVYLPVRYGDRAATKEDVARARRAYERMRREK